MNCVATPTFQYLSTALGCNVGCRAKKDTATARAKFAWVLQQYGLGLESKQVRVADKHQTRTNVVVLPWIEEFIKNTNSTLDEIMTARQAEE